MSEIKEPVVVEYNRLHFKIVLAEPGWVFQTTLGHFQFELPEQTFDIEYQTDKEN